MSLRTAFAGLLYVGLATAIRYNDNQVALVKDDDKAAKNFPSIEEIKLQSPAFTNPEGIPAGFDNGTSGPTTDATMEYFLQSLALRNDWMTYTNPAFKSDEGRSLPYVFLSTSNQPEIKANSSSEKLRVYLQGGVHGNEPGGDEALLALLGKLDANSTWAASVLEKMDILILPRYNPDGVANFQRYLATGYDPNRDHIRFASEQTRHVKALIIDFAPHIAVDSHEYSANRGYGAEEQWAQAVDGQFDAMKNLNIHKDIREYSEKIFAPRIAGAMENLGLRWSPYVTGNFREEPVVLTQLDTQARAGDVSLALTQTMVFLTETRGIMLGSQHFQRRVASGLTMVEAIVQTAADKAEDVKKVIEGARKKYVDGDDGIEIVVNDTPQPSNRTWDMIELETGKLVKVPVKFFSSTPIKANITRARPEAYIFPQAWKEAAERLRLNGVKVENIRSEFKGEVEAYNVTSVSLASTVYQGTVLNTVTTETKKKEINMPAGSFWVSTRQQAAAYAFTVLEPENIDSYATFNIFPVNVGDEYPVYRVMA
ncbi:carboxypeptidase [Fusarium heterosporum]|uniref:Carboxypeptidase n=1 Tax=Fusarium heterosporum TaxID=42747 RepID=A0A8H5TBN1_FUSHE|nr:carboxypeptidase [Fusarium heterosporum]